MAIWTWKQHDTWPPGFAVLEAPNEEGVLGPIDLTTAVSVKIVAREKSAKDPTSPLFKVNVTVVSAPDGRIKYTPLAAHTETVGELSIEFEIDWGSGRIQTVPSTGYEAIDITDDLG